MWNGNKSLLIKIKNEIYKYYFNGIYFTAKNVKLQLLSFIQFLKFLTP